MKKLKYLFIVLVVFSIVGCSKASGLENISYSEYKELISNKENFVLEVMRDGCSHCETLKPRLESVASEYNLDIKVINLAHLSDEDYIEFTKEIGTGATPTVIFYKKGEEKSVATRIIGSVSEEKIINKFKDNGIIK